MYHFLMLKLSQKLFLVVDNMGHKNKILVIGSYIVALVMESKRIPSPGETLMGNNFHSTYGGKGSNQAVQAARLGASVAFVTRIGNDNSGKEFLELCKKEGISDRFISIDEEYPTATGFIISSSSTAQNIITIDIAALKNISCNDIDLALNTVNKGDIVLLQLEIPVELAYYAAVTAHMKGAIVIFNPAPACNLVGYDLSVIDYLTPNETEARICIGVSINSTMSDEEVGNRLVEMGCSNVIITLGEKGALLCNKNEIQFFNSFKLKKAVDTTGAGDAFNAALAKSLSEHQSISEAICFANAVAAFACSGIDTIPSYGNSEQIDMFIKQYR